MIILQNPLKSRRALKETNISNGFSANVKKRCLRQRAKSHYNDLEVGKTPDKRVKRKFRHCQNNKRTNGGNIYAQRKH